MRVKKMCKKHGYECEIQKWTCDNDDCHNIVTVHWMSEYWDAPTLVLCKKCNHGHQIAGAA